MSVEEILEFYEQSGAQMFETAKLRHRLRYRYQSEPLANMLKSVFGENTYLGSDAIETLLLHGDEECHDGFPLAYLEQTIRQIQ